MDRPDSMSLEQLTSGTLEACHPPWSCCWSDVTAPAGCATLILMMITSRYSIWGVKWVTYFSNYLSSPGLECLKTQLQLCCLCCRWVVEQWKAEWVGCWQWRERVEERATFRQWWLVDGETRKTGEYSMFITAESWCNLCLTRCIFTHMVTHRNKPLQCQL